jgi:hypothetical protein
LLAQVGQQGGNTGVASAAAEFGAGRAVKYFLVQVEVALHVIEQEKG